MEISRRKFLRREEPIEKIKKKKKLFSSSGRDNMTTTQMMTERNSGEIPKDVPEAGLLLLLKKRKREIDEIE